MMNPFVVGESYAIHLCDMMGADVDLKSIALHRPYRLRYLDGIGEAVFSAIVYADEGHASGTSRLIVLRSADGRISMEVTLSGEAPATN